MKDLTVGKEGRLILVFAIPMLLGNVFQQMYNMVDTWVVGNYIGPSALAAVGASFPLIWMLIALIAGSSQGFTIVISQYFGARDYKKVKQAIDTMFVFIFIASLIITAIGFILSPYVFKWIGLEEEVIPHAILYFQIYVGGVLLMFGYYGTAAVLRGLGDSKTPLVFLVIATILNIALDLFFVLKLNMGVGGVAIATVIAHGLSFFLCVVYLNRVHPIIKFSFKNFQFDSIIFKQSLRIGLPTGAQQFAVALGMVFIYGIVADFGTQTAAAYTVAVRLDSFASMPAMNFSMALSAFVGQNLGANRVERVRKGFISTLVMTGVMSIMVTFVFYFFGRQLISFFTNESEVIAIGVSYLAIVSAFYILYSSMFVTHGVLRGAGATLIPMFITIFSLWVLRIPLSYFLSRPSVGLGSDGIWWGIPIAWASGFIFSLIYYASGKWRSKVVVKTSGIKND